MPLLPEIQPLARPVHHLLPSRLVAAFVSCNRVGAETYGNDALGAAGECRVHVGGEGVRFHSALARTVREVRRSLMFHFLNSLFSPLHPSSLKDGGYLAMYSARLRIRGGN